MARALADHKGRGGLVAWATNETTYCSTIVPENRRKMNGGLEARINLNMENELSVK